MHTKGIKPRADGPFHSTAWPQLTFATLGAPEFKLRHRKKTKSGGEVEKENKQPQLELLCGGWGHVKRCRIWRRDNVDDRHPRSVALRRSSLGSPVPAELFSSRWQARWGGHNYRGHRLTARVVHVFARAKVPFTMCRVLIKSPTFTRWHTQWMIYYRYNWSSLHVHTCGPIMWLCCIYLSFSHPRGYKNDVTKLQKSNRECAFDRTLNVVSFLT